MFVDQDAADRLRAFFTGRGLAFPERNLKQAMLIPSAMALPNPRGTAPGWWVERNDKVIVAMPGPPNEMQRMWENEVEHRLQEMSGGEVLVKRVLKTVGVGESTIDEMVAPLLKGTNPSIGVYAKPDGVYLRLAAKARTKEEAAQAHRAGRRRGAPHPRRGHLGRRRRDPRERHRRACSTSAA